MALADLFKNRFLTLKNDTYLVALLLFNCAIILNYSAVIWESKVIMLSVLITILTLINFRHYWLIVINIILSIYWFLPCFPRLANHSNIQLSIGIVILLVFALRAVFSSFSISPTLMSYIFRVSLITIYFCTGFHKLNTDFLNGCVSCVNNIHVRFIENFTGSKISLTQTDSAFLQYTALFTELILPFGLLFCKTRKITAIALLSFHFYLSLVYYADFSALSTFLIIGSVLNFENKSFDTKILTSLKLYIIAAIAIVIVRSVLFKLNYTVALRSFIFGILYNIGLLIFLIPFFKNYIEKTSFYKKTYNFYTISIITIISFWSLKTYVGLGNTGNLTMFSNLLTEKSRSNHLLIDTKKTKLYDFEEDKVLILKIDKKAKVKEMEGFLIPITEFMYLAKNWSAKSKNPIQVTIRYKEKTIIIPDLKKSEYTKPKWWYHYIPFRKIQPIGPNKCYW